MWLLAAVAFVGAGVLVLTRRPFWSVVAIAAVVASVPVLALNPSRNVAGLVMDGLVVAVAIATWTISRTRERRAI